MKRAREVAHNAMEFTCCDNAVLGWSHSLRCDGLASAITARDAEHRAELDAAQATIEQLGKDAAALATKLDRAVELLKTAATDSSPAMDAWDEACDAFLESLAAPPPVESTPVHGIPLLPPRRPHVYVEPEQVPPDDIRERLEGRMRWHDQQFAAIDTRLAALEAKGEPGTYVKGAKP